ncbi:hypothetical protein LMG28138_00448 [Pararobbsia alpina]|uniref:Uncharacterized protein n=2 Tax=Pararobbsia alpina TaxID=621374 RepID=A0A6S7B0V1_9BURK|nr:hypothetical protein LMG28138_00448 [Pararobbsia alpina]
MKQHPKRWHPALAELRAKINEDVVAVNQLKKQYGWDRAHPDKIYPHRVNHVSATWERFCDAGQILIATHRRSVARLSLGSYERGLALLNAICHATEKRGYVVSMVDSEERLRLSRDGAHVELRIAEKVTRGHRARPNNLGQAWDPVRTLTPTGRLVLTVEQQGAGQAELVDQPGKWLEDQPTEILAAVARQHQRSLAHVAERAQWKRESEETAIRRREHELKAREAQRKGEVEAQRRLALISEVEDWHRAVLIRAYLSMLDNRLADGSYAIAGYEQWREWARRVADDLDRSNQRVSMGQAAPPSPENPTR